MAAKWPLCQGSLLRQAPHHSRQTGDECLQECPLQPMCAHTGRSLTPSPLLPTSTPTTLHDRNKHPCHPGPKPMDSEHAQENTRTHIPEPVYIMPHTPVRSTRRQHNLSPHQPARDPLGRRRPAQTSPAPGHRQTRGTVGPTTPWMHSQHRHPRSTLGWSRGCVAGHAGA